jgi:hypothetical protein
MKYLKDKINQTYTNIYRLAEMPGVARAGFRTPLASIQPATKRIQHPLIVVAKHQPQNRPNEKPVYCRFQSTASERIKNKSSPGLFRTDGIESLVFFAGF